MSSSLRNAIPRRSHRERGQLKERERLGLLEKHKDYALRARDHKKKQRVLKSLKRKAADRNEDEFYFGMLSRGKFSATRLSGGRRWTGTVAGDRGNTALGRDTVRLLKTQDLGYLRTMRNVTAKAVVQLEQTAVVAAAFAAAAAIDTTLPNEDASDDKLDNGDGEGGEEDDGVAPRTKRALPRPKKLVFAESLDELENKFPQAKDDHDDGGPVNFGNHLGRLNSDEHLDAGARTRAQNAESLRRKLQNARKKLKALTDAENELDMQRARMAKTATVGGITKTGKKFKVRERKR